MNGIGRQEIAIFGKKDKKQPIEQLLAFLEQQEFVVLWIAPAEIRKKFFFEFGVIRI